MNKCYFQPSQKQNLSNFPTMVVIFSQKKGNWNITGDLYIRETIL